MGKNLVPPGGGSENGGDGNIQPVDLKAALEERYLAYALSTIMHRALPDVRDGMKPVHRRIVYAMNDMGLKSNSSFRKCAKIVGEVMGNYHPHGDQSIYDALVRLAQDFAVRYPLVNGQGNFGNIDGDSAAAMRYTESKMTAVAELLLDGIGEDAVDFRDTYDESNAEPVVLPGAFPNLLANGSTGIAVGMATSIPPHNAHELCDAALHLIKHPDAPVEKLVDFISGPDFPTGGIIIDDRAQIVEAYRTGRGGFRVRAKWEIEDLGRGEKRSSMGVDRSLGSQPAGRCCERMDGAHRRCDLPRDGFPNRRDFKSGIKSDRSRTGDGSPGRRRCHGAVSLPLSR